MLTPCGLPVSPVPLHQSSAWTVPELSPNEIKTGEKSETEANADER
jgi:hypothetical protein